MASQLLRSGTSPSLNYGEALSAESRSYFIHKLKIALKELRETKNNILIIQKANLSTNKELMILILKESSELIAILVKSTETAQKNKLNAKQ
jgi:four helix bundle protein